MNIDFSDKTRIMETYDLTERQYTNLISDLGKLTPAEVQQLSDKFVLAWKALGSDGGPAGDLPTLPLPDQRALTKLSGWASGAIPSPGAAIMAQITDMSAEQRRQNKDLYALEVENIVATIQDQADDLRDKATTQLVLTVVSGAVSIAQGATSMAMSAKAPKPPNGALPGSPEMMDYNRAFSAHTVKIQSVTTSMGAVSSSMAGVGQAAGGYFDAGIKEKDAEIEKMRASMEELKSMNQTFTEIIQKSNASQETIAQGMNAARTKILG